MRVKVGDKIRVKYAYPDFPYKAGDIFEVSETYANSRAVGVKEGYYVGGGMFEIITEEEEKRMSKAQVGDLIRVKNDAWVVRRGHAEKGGIYEVVDVAPDGSGIGLKDVLDGSFYVEHHEYEIFRKAGEEESEVEGIKIPFRREIQNEPNDAQMTQANRIRAACSELAELLVRKNHDYGDSFAKQYDKYGPLSALIRIDDKVSRLQTLIDGEKAQVAESMADSALDGAGYFLLMYVEEMKRK